MEAVADILSAHGRKLTTVASIVLVVLMSLSIANAVLFFVENIGDDAIAPQPAKVNRPATDSGPDIDLAALNLFGTVEEASIQQVVDAPETNLNLELQGVFTAEDPDESTAIVAERNKTGELFRIGERLPGNAILEAVYNDHILIKRSGRVEKLAFSDAPLRRQFDRGNTSALSTPTPSPQLGNNDTTSRLQSIRERIAERRREAVQRRNATIRPDSGGETGSSVREQVDRYRERIRENPQAVLDELGVSPVSTEDAQGYQVSGDIPEAALRQAGLQQGDVILSVNGRPVGNVVNDQAMIDQAMAAGRVRVEVQRGDRRFFLTVPIPK